jgi:hypothetical protein
VLGPVLPLFEDGAPAWVTKGAFYYRATYPTGLIIDWTKGRTGNTLLRMRLFENGMQPFNPEFRAAEDQDFFRRMIEKGSRFKWCNEAAVSEFVPPQRWKRSVMLKRALLRGACAKLHPAVGLYEGLKSLTAVAVYSLCLPFASLAGHHRFMTLLVKLCDHLGKLLAFAGINPVKTPYVTE